MKNADDMLKQIIKTVDTNGDGKIQYEGGFCGRSTGDGYKAWAWAWIADEVLSRISILR